MDEVDSTVVVISASVGLKVVGEAVVGTTVVGLSVVGESVVGTSVVGLIVVGETVVGASVHALVGTSVDGVVGTCVEALVGTSVDALVGTCVEALVGLVVTGPEAGHQAPLQAWQFALLCPHQLMSLWALASHHGLRKLGAQPHSLIMQTSSSEAGGGVGGAV